MYTFGLMVVLIHSLFFVLDEILEGVSGQFWQVLVIAHDDVRLLAQQALCCAYDIAQCSFVLQMSQLSGEPILIGKSSQLFLNKYECNFVFEVSIERV